MQKCPTARTLPSGVEARLSFTLDASVHPGRFRPGFRHSEGDLVADAAPTDPANFTDLTERDQVHKVSANCARRDAGLRGDRRLAGPHLPRISTGDLRLVGSFGQDDQHEAGGALRAALGEHLADRGDGHSAHPRPCIAIWPPGSPGLVRSVAIVARTGAAAGRTAGASAAGRSRTGRAVAGLAPVGRPVAEPAPLEGGLSDALRWAAGCERCRAGPDGDPAEPPAHDRAQLVNVHRVSRVRVILLPGKVEDPSDRKTANAALVGGVAEQMTHTRPQESPTREDHPSCRSGGSRNRPIHWAQVPKPPRIAPNPGVFLAGLGARQSRLFPL